MDRLDFFLSFIFYKTYTYKFMKHTRFIKPNTRFIQRSPRFIKRSPPFYKTQPPFYKTYHPFYKAQAPFYKSHHVPDFRPWELQYAYLCISLSPTPCETNNKIKNIELFWLNVSLLWHVIKFSSSHLLVGLFGKLTSRRNRSRECRRREAYEAENYPNG